MMGDGQRNEEEEGTADEADMFDEDFGKMKMAMFRERCRNVLGGPHGSYRSH